MSRRRGVAATSGEFFAQLADRVSVGLAAVIAVLDPSLVVLAGQVAQAGGETLREAVAAAMLRHAPLEASIAVTTIDDDAVLLGALDAGLTAVRESLLTQISDADLTLDQPVRARLAAAPASRRRPGDGIRPPISAYPTISSGATKVR